ncbi:MAG TPA: hypothetical protein G4O15_07310 [Dehalococcoidia bacterium]|nr:hypothetical protein [Dehalococcoidia bacterium]
MSSFLIFIAEPAVGGVVEKTFFGKHKVSIGSLYNVVGYWAYQQGAVLGYALRNNLKLLAKLAGLLGANIHDKEAEELTISLREWLRKMALEQLEEAGNEEKTFYHLYTARELRTFGIKNPRWPSDKALKKKVDTKFVGRVLRSSFIKGVALGLNFPTEFINFWEYTYRIRSNSESKETSKIVDLETETQPFRTLSEVIVEICRSTISWASEGSGILSRKEIKYLEQLVIENE